MIELVFALFLLSGFVKFFFATLLSGIPIPDLTLVSAALLALIYGYHFLKNVTGNRFYVLKGSRALIFTLGVLYLWMIVTLIYTRSPGFAYIKTGLFMTCAISLLFPFLYREFRPRKFFTYFVYIGSGLIFVYSALLPKIFASYMRFYQDREFVVKYLDIGYLAGMIILIAAFACPRMKRLTKILIIGVNAWALLISAARGPILFLALVLSIKFAVVGVRFLRKSWSFNLRNIVYMVVGFGILGAGAYYFLDRYAELIERTFKRLLLVFDPYSSSVSERVSQFSFSLDTIFDNVSNLLFGVGIGSFGIYYHGVDELAYPHNVILEIGFEMGLIGLVIFSLLIFIYYYKIKSNFNYFIIFFYLLLNSLKSYSLVGSRIMYGIMGVLLVMHLAEKGLNHEGHEGHRGKEIKPKGNNSIPRE